MMGSIRGRIPKILDTEINEVADSLGMPKTDKLWRTQAMAIIAYNSKQARLGIFFNDKKTKK